MKYSEILKHLAKGEVVRRKRWHKTTAVKYHKPLDYKIGDDDIPRIVYENGDKFIANMDDIKADDWEVVNQQFITVK